jgi:hypothetical protein
MSKSDENRQLAAVFKTVGLKFHSRKRMISFIFGRNLRVFGHLNGFGLEVFANLVVSMVSSVHDAVEDKGDAKEKAESGKHCSMRFCIETHISTTPSPAAER